jgi:lipopolysaccharide export system protein LptC
MRRNLTVTLLLLFFTGLSWWLMTTFQQQQEQTRIKEQKKGPNYTMEDFSAIRMNEQGLPEYELNAPYMAHYPQQDRTDLKQPKFTVHERARQQTWADQGTVLKQGDEILLTGNVVIRGHDENQKVLRIETPVLRILPNDEYAETQEAVHITRGDNVLDAVGAKVYLDQHVLLLLSKVRGTYVPNT